MSLEIDLSDFCRMGNVQRAIDFLKSHTSDRIDVLYKKGLCFRLALKNVQYELFGALLEYYQETLLDRDQDQTTYRKSLEDLHVVLHDIVDNYVTSIEARDLMRSYISFDAYTDLKDIKSKTSNVGLRVPYLDEIDNVEDLDICDVQKVLSQLKDMKYPLEITSHFMHITNCLEQAKVIGESIELLESQFDLARDEDTLSQDDGDTSGEGGPSVLHKSNSAPDMLSHQGEKITTKLLYCSSESLFSKLDSSDGDVDDTSHSLGRESGLLTDF